MATRYEVQIDMRDPDTGSELHGQLQWASSGPDDTVERKATEAFDRVKRAMQGEDTGIFADHITTVTLLKGDPADISDTPNQTPIDSYTRESSPNA